MSFEIYSKRRKNSDLSGISFSKSTIYFYKDFALKNIPKEFSSVELYNDPEKQTVGFRFVKQSPDGYTLYSTPTGMRYVTLRAFEKIMRDYGYAEKQLYAPVKAKNGLWIVKK